MTIDPVAQVLPFGSDAFWGVVGRFRRDLVGAAAAEGIDLVYTYVFGPGDEEHVADVVAAFEERGGVVTFVQLQAPRDVLLRRVVEEDRKQHGKLTDVETLARLLDEYDGFTSLAAERSLTLDLGALSAAEAADEIISRLSGAS